MQRNCPNRAENETELRKEWSRSQPSTYKLNSLAAGSSLMIDGKLNSLAAGSSLMIDGYIGK